MATMMKQQQGKVIADYDHVADVLYVTLGPPVPADGEDAPRGIILRYSIQDDSPAGATVVGLVHNAWIREIDGLAGALAEHLHAAKNEISEAIRVAIAETAL